MDDQFKPGTFGCHEVLHMTSFLAEAVHEQLCNHEAIKKRPDWLNLAEHAETALATLYQAIGREHL